ncbi:MAG: 1-acyl-sn-glycerol-3-phosphate acyltransferase [Paludibacteraceae bacterium]|jgi:1-acyl-sn-glycerol-3-phosphate acyltransferase|nr:1-acyl-sn-glycerol-3-phosphate acyltransferase [Paludibacteraceae bacterium]
MSKIFIYIYNWFDKHKIAFYAILIVLVGAFAIMASQLTLQENIINFFSNSDKNKNTVFENVKAKDKIIIMLTGNNPDAIIESAEIFELKIDSLINDGLVKSITASVDEDVISNVTSFVYEFLPIFLTDEDYKLLEEKVSEEGINNAISRAYKLLTSPSGMVIGDVIMRDPLNVGTHLLQKFEQFNPELEYEIYNGRLFTKDLSTMLIFLEPANSMGDTGKNNDLVIGLERAEELAEINDVSVDCIGGPIVAVYNARQIKKDIRTTLSLALIFILLVIFFSFRNKWSIPFIIIPPAFGALFALAMIWLIQGEISAIAIGTGTVILGVSVSYSIHMVSHLNYISSPKRIIKELTLPLTIGSFTTIGAFAALMFTSSGLLQDMGLFSVFALIGTTLFCLIFLPQFLKGFDASKKSTLLNKVEKVLGYNYDNKWIITPIIILTIIALFCYKDVKFDDNMSNINYMPEHIIEAEKRSLEIFGDESKDIFIVTGHENFDTLIAEYQQLETLLNKYKQAGKIENVVTINDFVIPYDEQNRRLAKWNAFWSKNREKTLDLIQKSAYKQGFRENAFYQFEEIITKDYVVCTYSNEEVSEVPVISEWVNSSSTSTSILSHIVIDQKHKTELYAEIDELSNTAVIDRAYFSSKMVESTNADFDYILFISSLIVFLALLLSYGRIELTLLTFLPMAISWVIILGLMALLDIKFNIVNIILATFIFGIGDDFSIFIMDGLLQDYKNGKKIIAAHKTAIFFSAFTAIVGMGVLIFAQHPALKSIALISVLGLSVVVLVSFTIQPMLFRLLVTSQTKKGNFPYTLLGILNTIYAFVYFLLGCVILQLYILVLLVLPIKREKKKLSFHKLIYRFTWFFLRTMITVKTIRQNPYNEKYDKPAVIIANHQSFIDILLLLSTTPKIVMVTNSWVWNSPFFGWIVQYADFHHSADGYEALAEKLKERISEGYSVVMFPEGTRSADCSIQRFRKGAFYLAQLLKIDILPMIIYGAGKISAKTQGFYIKSGVIATKTMMRVKYGDTSFGKTYQEQSKAYRRWYIEQYSIMSEELKEKNNIYFKDALIKNYIYKGPVLEWYMRIKCRLDGYYTKWDKLIHREAKITDMGCGYGQMSFMLSLLSPKRTIVAIDYDKNKIELAEHSFLSKKCNVEFKHADMRSVEIPISDAILFNDSLHYVDAESQKQILIKAVKSLTKRGLIIVRDGDSSLTEKHKRTKHTEIWSTQIIKFNKTSQKLTFVSSKWMSEFAEKTNMNIDIQNTKKGSSETIYILTKK